MDEQQIGIRAEASQAMESINDARRQIEESRSEYMVGLVVVVAMSSVFWFLVGLGAGVYFAG